MANQYASAPGYGNPMGVTDPKNQALAAQVNAGSALPNLDPGKVGAPTNADLFNPVAQGYARNAAQYGWSPRDGAGQPTKTPWNDVKTFMDQPPQAPVGGTPPATSQPSATDTLATLSPQIPAEIGRRLRGELSGPELEESKRVQDQLRYDQSQQAGQSLATRGFAPSSALGLEYSKAIDKNVAALMIQNRAQVQQQALGQAMAYQGAMAGQNIAQQQQDYYLRALAANQALGYAQLGAQKQDSLASNVTGGLGLLGRGLNVAGDIYNGRWGNIANDLQGNQPPAPAGGGTTLRQQPLGVPNVSQLALPGYEGATMNTMGTAGPYYPTAPAYPLNTLDYLSAQDPYGMYRR